VDRQVKVRGQRVELDDVERTLARAWAALLTDGAADAADCVAVAATPAATPGGSADGATLLVAFVARPSPATAAAAAPVSTAALRQALLRADADVPAAHVPALVLALDTALPRTATGKLDRAALQRSADEAVSAPPPPPPTAAGGGSAPALAAAAYSTAAGEGADAEPALAAAVARVVAEVFADVLPAAAAASASNASSFYALGGDSMTAVEAVWRLQRQVPWASRPASEPPCPHIALPPLSLARCRGQGSGCGRTRCGMHWATSPC
jgi:hypothetical protein